MGTTLGELTAAWPSLIKFAGAPFKSPATKYKIARAMRSWKVEVGAFVDQKNAMLEEMCEPIPGKPGEFKQSPEFQASIAELLNVATGDMPVVEVALDEVTEMVTASDMLGAEPFITITGVEG